MNKNIKIVLNYLNTYGFVKNCDIEVNLPITIEEFKDTLNYLTDKQVIKSETIIELENGFRYSNKYYYSTFYSKNYYKIKYRRLFFKFCKYLITGIILPCVVAYLTSRFTKSDCEYCSYSDNCGQCNSVKP